MIRIRPFLFLLVSFSTGFSLAFYLLSGNENDNEHKAVKPVAVNPFSTLDQPVSGNDSGHENTPGLDSIILRLESIENRLDQIDRTIGAIDLQADDNAGKAAYREATAGRSLNTMQSMREQARRVSGSAINRRLFDVDNLVNSGIDPATAQDIVRRKNQAELKKLELLDRARREGYLETEQYYSELEQINAQDVNLREELGEDDYDQYLFDSKQHNRVRITQVILGSEAEKAGIQSNDIVYSYDNQRVFTWQDLQSATAEGNLGEYVNIVIDRDGEIMGMSVPRGPLGVQLGYARDDPRN